MRQLVMIGAQLVACLVVVGILAGVSLARAPDIEALVLSMTEGQGSPDATIDDAAWLAGNWSGKSTDGLAEESYLQPAGGSVVGMFRQLKDGKPTFYEFLVISEHEGSLLYRIKHFNPDMHGWEKQNESIDFPLVKATENALYFDGLTYMKTGESTMSAYVRIEYGDGKTKVEGFHFRRMEDN